MNEREPLLIGLVEDIFENFGIKEKNIFGIYLQVIE